MKDTRQKMGRKPKPDPMTARINVPCTQKLKDAVVRRAVKRHLDLAELVRQALEQHVEQERA